MSFDHIAWTHLDGATIDFVDLDAPSLLDRWLPHYEWWQGRMASRIDPYSKFTPKGIATECTSCTRDGTAVSGVNFASQDYLNLSTHPAVRAAAVEAVREYGVHSAGSAALMGNTALSVRLEQELADFLGYRDCTVFPTGWGAGYGVIKTLVQP